MRRNGIEKHRDPLPTMNDLIPKDRRPEDIQPIREGIPVGTIRVGFGNQGRELILSCGHRNVLLNQDKETQRRFYKCFHGHRDYID